METNPDFTNEDVKEALERINRLPAQFEHSLAKITERNLMQRFLIGLDNMVFKDPDKKLEIIASLPSSTHELFESADHGLKQHCPATRQRALEIYGRCSLLRELINHQFEHDFCHSQIDWLMTWTSIMHDIGRFLGNHDFQSHERFGAEFAQACFKDQQATAFYGKILFDMIIHHDFIRYCAKRGAFDRVTFSPLAEIFRLADTTSNSAEAEIARYHATGKRILRDKFCLLNPEISDDDRIGWLKTGMNLKLWDQIQYDLLFFVIGPGDWTYGETRDLYRAWSDHPETGKAKAAQYIVESARESGEDADLIIRVLKIFFSANNLPQYLD